MPISWLLSVVVNELNLFRARLGPLEADPPLIVDPDAVLTPAITLERFEPIPGRNAEVGEIEGGMEDLQLAQGRPLHLRIHRSDPPFVPDLFSSLVPERPDHDSTI
jgi:hypothetical protein